jgi:hypothetical protein
LIRHGSGSVCNILSEVSTELFGDLFSELPIVNCLGVKWFENLRFSSSRESVALSNDPEASYFDDALCRQFMDVIRVRRERSLHRRSFRVTHS